MGKASYQKQSNLEEFLNIKYIEGNLKWGSKSGGILIQNMTDSHLENAKNKLRENLFKGNIAWKRVMIGIMTKEMDKRKRIKMTLEESAKNKEKK